MTALASMRGMIGSMYAVYAIDLGVQLGLFDQLARNEEPVPIEALARDAHCNASGELLVAWMRAAQAAGVIHVDDDNRVSFRDDWRGALTDPDSTEYIATLPRCYIALSDAYPRFARLFKEGRPMAWQELGRSVVEDISADSLRAANYFIENVVDMVPGLREKLEHGADVCDVGCGAGHMTLKLATAFPNSTFVGIDPWQEAIGLATEHAREQSLTDRVSFQTLCATKLMANSADLILLNDVLHEMDVEVRLPALRVMRKALKKGGGIYISDPIAPARAADYLKESARVPAITLFFEAPFGAKVHTRKEMQELLKAGGLEMAAEIESSDNDISAYLRPTAT